MRLSSMTAKERREAAWGQVKEKEDEGDEEEAGEDAQQRVKNSNPVTDGENLGSLKFNSTSKTMTSTFNPKRSYITRLDNWDQRLRVTRSLFDVGITYRFACN